MIIFLRLFGMKQESRWEKRGTDMFFEHIGLSHKFMYIWNKNMLLEKYLDFFYIF